MATVVALQSNSSGVPKRPDAASSTSPSAQSSVQRAKLTVHTPMPGGVAGGQIGTVDFQFNPSAVTVSKTTEWSERKEGQPAQYLIAKPCTLSFEMFLDATTNPEVGVVSAVEQLLACCAPTEQSLETKTPEPPLVKLQWGTVFSFPAYVTSVTATYSLFASSGMPIRATCQVSMTEMHSTQPRQNPTSGSEAVRRVHRMVAGDTVATVAYAEYGDPARWRDLARWNDIDDPLRVPIGSLLLVPSVEDLTR